MSIVARHARTHWAYLGFLLVAAGCGGGGSTSVNSTATPNLSIDWAARSRGFTGPSSALSAKFTIHTAGGSDVTFSEDRAAAAAAYTGSYTAPQAVKIGTHLIDVKFYADAGAAGAEVGSASISAKVQIDGSVVRADGSPLGSVQTDSTITSVALTADQTVDAGTSKQLTVTAMNAASQVVAISTGSAFFAVTAGADKMTSSTSGLAQGLALGTATVVVTLGNLTSAAGTVTVTAPTPTVRSFAATTNSIATDSSRHLIYATVPGTDATNPNGFVAYDPATGAITKSVALPSEGWLIVLSDDFKYAYISQNAVGKVARVALDTFTVDENFLLSTTAVDTAFRMQVRPGHPNQVAVAHFIGGGSESAVTIYDSGVALPNTGAGAQIVAFSGPDKLYGGHFGTMTSYSVDNTGVTATGSNANAPGASYAYMFEAAGKLYLNTYGVLDGTTMNILGTYPGKLQNSQLVPDATRGYAYGFTWQPGAERKFQVFRKSDFGEQMSLQLGETSSTGLTFVQLSATSFAYSTANPSKINVIENVYLP